MDTRKFPWTSTSSSPGAQIDLVIERPGKIVHLCEMKCTNDPFCVTADVAKELRRKATVFKEETDTKSSAQIVIVASAGVKPGAHADVAAHVVTGDDLFA